MKLKIKKDFFLNAILLFIAIGIFINGYCYLTWETYENAIIRQFARNYAQLSKIVLIIYGSFIAKNKNNRISMRDVMCILLSIIFIIHTHYFGYKYYSDITLSDIVFIACIIILLILPDDTKMRLFKYALIAFTIAVFPSLIYFLLEQMGIKIPSSILQVGNNEIKVAEQWYYSHYPLGLITRQYGHMSRMAGIFDEAGFVGTFSAIFITGGYNRVPKKWIIMLAIEGLFSFSMAFYLLMIVFIIIKAFQRGAKKLMTVLILLAIAFIVFINTDFQNEAITNIQRRIDLSSFYLIKNNRTNASFDIGYSLFIRDGGYPIFMGYGGMGAYNENALLKGASSYKTLLFDYGLIGCIFYFGIFISIYLNKYKYKSTLPFFLVFIISVYQRPYIFTYLYMFVFITGLSITSSTERKYIHLKKLKLETGKVDSKERCFTQWVKKQFQ